MDTNESQEQQYMPFTYVPPYLYRYENQEFIDKFFDTGEILISCFSVYKQYTDNQLGDTSEGHVLRSGEQPSGQTIFGYTIVGSNAYTLCTSTRLDNKLLTTFSRNGVFRIKEPFGFIAEVAKVIPGVFHIT